MKSSTSTESGAPDVEDTAPHFDPIGGPVEDVVEGALKDLAVNLMRVARGSGEPSQIVRQVAACAEALRRHTNELRHAPSAQRISEILDFNAALPPHTPPLQGDERRRAVAMDRIVAGGLRVAAARYRLDFHQATSGENDIIDGIRQFQGEPR